LDSYLKSGYCQSYISISFGEFIGGTALSRSETGLIGIEKKKNKKNGKWRDIIGLVRVYDDA
jgi:hypothetical protein